MKKNVNYFICFLITIILNSPIYANKNLKDVNQLNVIHLNANTTTEIVADEIKIQLSIEEKGKDRNQIISNTTHKTNHILSSFKNKKNIRVQLTSRRTQPVYIWKNNKQQLDSWHDKAIIEIIGIDIDKITSILPDSQKYAEIENISYQLSKNKENEIKDQLMTEASQNFQHKVNVIANSFKKNNYRLLQIEFNDNSRHYVSSTRTSAKYGEESSLKAGNFDTMQSSEVIQIEPPIIEVNINVSGSVQLY